MKRIAIALSTIFCVAAVGVLGRAALREPVVMTSFAVSAPETPSPTATPERWRDAGCALEDCSTPAPLATARATPSPRAVRVAAAPPAVAPKAGVAKPTPKPKPAAPVLSSDDAWQRRGYVAHAFGSPPDGEIYTNSAEAFEHSYKKGFRAFEVDMMLLQDGEIALVHDEFERHFGLDKKFRSTTSDELRGRKFDGKYEVLLGDDFVDLVASHPGAYFILDPKVDHVEIVKWLVNNMEPALLDRLRPHVHSQDQIDAFKRLYPWKGMVIATYHWTRDAAVIEERVIELAVKNKIGTAMMRDDYYSDGMRARLEQAGVNRIWIHDATSSGSITSFRKKGVGVYSHGYISR